MKSTKCQLLRADNDLLNKQLKVYREKIDSLHDVIKRKNKSLAAILGMAIDDECDCITDIARDAIGGYELSRNYEEEAEKGRKYFNEMNQ
jgi:hypothetical protein